MEFPLQDFDLEDETDFLLGGSINHGGDMDGGLATQSRTPRNRKTLGTFLCG